jgi:hypothetical protein
MFYYWHSSTESKLFNGELDETKTDFSEEETRFWKSIPSYFLLAEEKPCFRSQLKSIREFQFLKSHFRQNPFIQGDIEALVSEVIFNNVYVWRDPVANEAQIIEDIKREILNFSGKVFKSLSEISWEVSKMYIPFFEGLNQQVRSLNAIDIVEISFGLPYVGTTLTWNGSEPQLSELFKSLLDPVKEDKVRVFFLGKDADYESFKSVFNKSQNSNKLRWLEVNPKNDEPTVISLLYLIKELSNNGLINRPNSAAIPKVIKSHFFNKQNETISNLKSIPNPKTERSKRILEIVVGLSSGKKAAFQIN